MGLCLTLRHGCPVGLCLKTLLNQNLLFTDLVSLKLLYYAMVTRYSVIHFDAESGLIVFAVSY